MNGEVVYEDIYGYDLSKHKSIVVCPHKEVIKLETISFKNLTTPVMLYIGNYIYSRDIQ